MAISAGHRGGGFPPCCPAIPERADHSARIHRRPAPDSLRRSLSQGTSASLPRGFGFRLLAEVEQGFAIGSAFTDHFVCAWPGRAKTVVLYRFNEHRDFHERLRHIVSRDHTRILALARCTRNAAARTMPGPETRWLTPARPE